MNLWTAIVAIVAIACFAEVLKAKFRAHHGEPGRPAEPLPPAKDPAMEREVQELRERIRVLERIATESNTTAALESRRVSDEIEALRGKRAS